MSNFVSFMSQRRGGSERSLGDSYEKVSLLPTSDLESDSSLDLPGRHRARHGHPHWRQIRHGWRLQKLVIRIVFFLALATIYFVSFDSRGSPASRSSLAAGLEHCRYIATTPGPSADFHQREHSDRFEAGTKAVLLKNAKIWTGNKDGSEVIEGDVLMANGLIKSVGQADVRMLEDLRAEGDVDEIDVDGKWVSPGMVDGHSHGEQTPVNRSLALIDAQPARTAATRWPRISTLTSES